jgi:hypothetical protein
MAKKTLKNRKSRRRTLRRKSKGGSLASTSQPVQIPTAALKVSDGGVNSDNKWHGI